MAETSRAVRAAACSSLALLAACAPDFRPASRLLGQALPPEREPVFERRRTYFDPRATQLSRERGVLIASDGSTVAHGRDVAWYVNGLLRFEREFDHGEPAGRWRTWYEHGQLESDATYARGARTTMSWWREDGALSSSGELLSGVREGEWLEFHDNGLPAARGRYAGGLRDGPWISWSPAGQLVECGWYERGERTGAWERGAGATQ